MRVLARLTALLVILGAATIPATVANAQPVKNLSEAERVRLAYELRHGGASATTIARRTGLVQLPTKTIAPLSVNTAVTVAPPYFYYDTANNVYHAYSEYSWNNNQSLGDGTLGGGNVGGFEALSIRFSQDVVQTSTPSGTIYWGAWTGAQPYPSQNAGGPLFPGLWDNSEEGASLQWQDRTASAHCSGADHPTCAQYNSGHGYLAYHFRPPTQCLQIFGQYAHTWGSTQISGVAISNSGFEVQFSSAENRWQASSGAALVGC